MVNNLAAMREALKTVKRYLDGYTVNVLEMRSQVDAALAKPPRQCDVGTAEEQSDRYEAQCDAYHKTTGKCDDCPIYKEECKMTGNIPHCQLVWAQMPYEEGGAK